MRPSDAELRVWRWLNGGCANFARAVQDAAAADEGVELRLGCHRGAVGIEHVFAHDDTRAYDALGSHPLPYAKQDRGWSDHYDVNPDEIEAVHPVDEDEIEQAADDGAFEVWSTR